MRPKTLVLLLLALGCGLVASIGISQVMQRNQDTGPAGETSPVWVAKQDIKPSEALTMQNLKLEQWPKEKVPPGALSKMDEIDGKRSRVTIYLGEAIIDKKLLSKDEVDISYTVPKGWRLYTVLGDPLASHGGLLHPGDRVDVMVYVSKSTGPLETGTKTILQDVRVFAVNDQVKPSDDKGNESITAKTVTLLLTPSQTEKIALASEIGKIHLVMRSPDDPSTVDPAGTRLGDIFVMEKADRSSENMDHMPVNPKTNTSPLTSLLNQVQAATVAVAAKPVSEDMSFTMQVIRGTEITQADFQRKFDDPTRWENGSLGHDANGGSKPDAQAPKDPPKKQATPEANKPATPGANPAKPDTTQPTSTTRS